MSLIKTDPKTMTTYLGLYNKFVDNSDKVVDEDGTTLSAASAMFGLNQYLETVKGIGLLLSQGYEIKVINSFSEAAQVATAFFVLREFLIEFKIIEKQELEL